MQEPSGVRLEPFGRPSDTQPVRELTAKPIQDFAEGVAGNYDKKPARVLHGLVEPVS
jgi:hypothetical protein